MIKGNIYVDSRGNLYMKNWKRSLLISVTVALSSELYWNAFVSGFRISIAVVLLPILLLTLGKNLSTIKTCTITACFILVFRAIAAGSSITNVPNKMLLLLPNAVFYTCYGIIFAVMIPNKHTWSYKFLAPYLFTCDFLSNILELCIFESDNNRSFTWEMVGLLALVALFRSTLATLVLMAESQYRTLLTKEEHENRYRRLFLMTTGLKNEIYFMRKNSEEIESVMGNAYRLYEKLSSMEDVPEEMKRMSLAIARDVHEIKKDYIRIIQGIEQEISEEYDEKRMSFQDLLNILEATTHHLLEEKRARIDLVFECQDNFITEKHYELMSVLKNIVNNAIEAIEGAQKKGTIHISEHLKDRIYEFKIEDDGPGISPRHLPNIFKMGYSTKFDYKTGNIYRGVGLYGVKTTVEEEFNGTIEVESELGTGTIFTIRIPSMSLEEV